MFEQTFKNIDDILYKDAGVDSEIDYIEQTSWIMFLRYLEELELKWKEEAEFENKDYQFLLKDKFRWSNWAAPIKTSENNQEDNKKDNQENNTKKQIDYNKIQTGEELINFVNQELFPHLANFKEKSQDQKSIAYKIGEIFSELKNKIKSGYNLRDIIDYADKLSFSSDTQKHELSNLYETKIKNMGNAGRNGGQYYTPRPLIRAMIRTIAPKIGETIYDGAAGSCGFLCEAYSYLREEIQKDINTDDLEILRTKTLYGKEKKNLAYVIGLMNMILHGVESPHLIHSNTLSENLADIQQKDRHDIILANPPFGGKERKEVQENFPIKTGETAFLFLQHFIKILKAGGRAAVVIKNTFLSNTDNASISLRKEILKSCQLYAILDMPSGTFLGAGVKTVVLFFKKGQPTENIWFYQLDTGRNLGKTNPLNDRDLEDFINLEKIKADSKNSWTIKVNDIDKETYDLSVKNPNAPEEAPLRHHQEILAEIKILESENKNLLEEVNQLMVDN